MRTYPKYFSICFLVCLLLLFISCAPVPNTPKPGPDKQSVGTFYGAALGAGAGAVVGTQLAASTGPGAWIGAGFGAVFGMLSGIGIDLIEEDQLWRLEEQERLRQIAWVQDVLADHYARRLELHPNRDIFPADLFFEGDSVTLRKDARLLVWEIARINQQRMPWSRIIITAYATAKDPDSSYARFLTERRSQALALYFVRAGVEARRVNARGKTLSEPLLIDPNDLPERYRQAVEIIPVDY